MSHSARSIRPCPSRRGAADVGDDGQGPRGPRFGLKLGVDRVALSFVQRPEDVAEARAIVQGRAGIMVKLEKPAAIHQLRRSSPPPMR